MSGLAILALSNLIYHYIQNKTRSDSSGFIFIQMSVDLLLLTFILHFSGGPENLFLMIYIFHVIIAGILLAKRPAYLITTLAWLLCLGLTLGEHTGMLNHYSLDMMLHENTPLSEPVHHQVYIIGLITSFTVFLWGTLYFTTYLVDKLRKEESKALQTVRQVTAEKKKLDLVVDTIGAGLILLGADHRTIWSNKKITEWFGAPNACPILQDFLNKKLTSALPEVTCPATMALKTGQVQEQEYVLKDTFQHKRFFHFSALPIKNEQEETVILELIRDITHEKETALQLLQSSKMSAIGELAGNIAHEINNPVGIIIGKVKLLLNNHEKHFDQGTISELEKIYRQSERIALITKGLLNFARPTVAKKENISINTVINESLLLVGSSLEINNIKVTPLLDNKLGLIYGNFNELQQVMINLLNNAMDAMPQGGELQIKTSSHNLNETEGFRIEISDTGYGINDEHLDHVFTPFFTTKQQKGTGLGLAICQKIISQHNGQIWVKSQPGQGSQFYIWLPSGNVGNRPKVISEAAHL